MRAAVALVFLSCFVPVSAQSVVRHGLASRVTPSPHDDTFVYLAEKRDDAVSEFTLTWVQPPSADASMRAHSLTPRYGPLVQSPAGDMIAYWSVDFARGLEVFVYHCAEGQGGLSRPLSLSSGTRGHRLEWSADSGYLRLQPELSDAWGPFDHQSDVAWHSFSTDGMFHVHNEDVAGAEWVPPIPAEDPPAYLSQRRPTLSGDSPIVWGADPTTLYVADAGGVWRVSLGAPFMDEWSRIADMQDVRALAVSPSGRHLVVEAGRDEEGGIYEMRLDSPDSVPTRVAAGWGIRFGTDHGWYFYAAYKGLYRKRPGLAAEGLAGAAKW
jgi:hypothetical protein